MFQEPTILGSMVKVHRRMCQNIFGKRERERLSADPAAEQTTPGPSTEFSRYRFRQEVWIDPFDFAFFTSSACNVFTYFANDVTLGRRPTRCQTAVFHYISCPSRIHGHLPGSIGYNKCNMFFFLVKHINTVRKTF